MGHMILCIQILAAPTARAAALLAMLAMLMLPQAADSAANAYSFAATPGRLPKTVVPVHYVIALEPDLDALTLAGAETVEIDVVVPTARLVLNAIDMSLTAVSLDDIPADSIALDAAAQTATLVWPRPFAVGRHRLRVDFAARINQFGRGLFLSLIHI